MQIKESFLEKPERMNKGAKALAQRYGVSEEEVKRVKQEVKDELKAEGKLVRTGYISTEFQQTTGNTSTTYEYEINTNSGTWKSTAESDFDPKDDIELAELHKINLEKYKISNYWSKIKPNGKFTSSVFATLRKIDKDLESQKDLLLSEFKKALPIIPIAKLNVNNRKYAYEINIADAHFGKMSWKEESGEHYDLKIAEKRYTDSVENLLSLVDTDKLERIILPIGNDMLNIDSRRNETFAGTSQDSDSRFFKIVQKVKEVLIKTINSLSLIAPVDVIVISGNHDPESMFMIGEILDAYYHSNPNVTIDNSPKQRKYYQYGKNGFQYTHGNEEPHQSLGLIFATEQAKLWADTEFRFAKLGHFHKNKKTNYISVDEHQGFQVQILPSISGTDAWHNSKGYMSKKQAKGFLYHRTEGEIAQFTYNIN